MFESVSDMNTFQRGRAAAHDQKGTLMSRFPLPSAQVIEPLRVAGELAAQ